MDSFGDAARDVSVREKTSLVDGTEPPAAGAVHGAKARVPVGILSLVDKERLLGTGAERKRDC